MFCTRFLCSLSLVFALLQLPERVVASTTISSGPSGSDADPQLMKKSRPVLYELSIRPNPQIFTDVDDLTESDFEYSGSVEITYIIYISDEKDTAPVRVKYPVEWLGFFGVSIRNGTFEWAGRNKVTNRDKIRLLSDVYALSVAGEYPLTVFFEFALCFVNEASHAVWSELLKRLSHVLLLMSDEDSDLCFEVSKFIRDLTASKVESLGFYPRQMEPESETLLRPVIFSYAGRAGDLNALGFAMVHGGQFMSGDIGAIPPDLRPAVLEISVGKYPTIFDWAFEHIYSAQPMMNDQNVAILKALPCSYLSKHNILKALSLTLNTEVIRPEDVVYVFEAASRNPSGQGVVWKFLKEHWSHFEHHPFLQHLLAFAINNLSDPSCVRDIDRFFTDKPHACKAISYALRNGLQMVRINSRFVARNRRDLKSWLLSQNEQANQAERKDT